jgi:SAM-dependent methyltransferase
MPHPGRWGRPPPAIDPEALGLHVELLNHRSRTEAYLREIRRVVQPGDVVVDLGSGTGVFGVAAVQSGAAWVYSIEGSAMAAIVRGVAAANGVDDRMDVIRGWSQDVVLPERADVIVSELVGNEPLSEGILEASADAARRFLKPGGVMLPSSLRIAATPVQLPRRMRRSAAVGPQDVRRWLDWYGIHFGALSRHPDNRSMIAFVNPWEARAWMPLGPAAVIADIDLARPQRPDGRPTPLPLARAGRLDAVIVHFELRSGDRPFISTAIDAVDEDNHWTCPVRYLRRPPVVDRDAALAVDYRPLGGVLGCEVLARDTDGAWMPLD